MVDPHEHQTGILIGMTTYGIARSDKFSLPAQYVQSVIRAGGLPLLLPGTAVDDVAPWLESIQGLVLTGGGDILPARYQAPPDETVAETDEGRDACEFELAAQAVRRKMPILAICRGLQILNVVLGGTLHTHLPDIYGKRVAHRLGPKEPVRHRVTLERNSLLAAVLGRTDVDVFSSHHQCVDRLGKGLYPVGRSEDGVIEALALADHPTLMAVQWHPEMSAAQDPLQQRLFDRLVAACCRCRLKPAAAVPLEKRQKKQARNEGRS